MDDVVQGHLMEIIFWVIVALAVTGLIYFGLACKFGLGGVGC